MVEKNKRNVVIACVISFLLLVVLMLLLFNSKTYTIEFNDGISKHTYEVKKNQKLSEPNVPEKEGYVFVGWYKDGKLYDFDLKVKEDFTLIAKYEKQENNEVNEPDVEITTTTTTTTASITTTTAKTTKKDNNKTTTKAPVVTTKPTTTATKAPVVTTKPTTSTTTTTKVVTYSVVRIDVTNSTIGQQMIYVKNNSTGSYVSGTVRITYISGSSEVVSVPESGKMIVKSTIASITDAKGN